MGKPNRIPNQNGSSMHLKANRRSRTPSFACKHDGYHKAWLVAAGKLTPDPIDSFYSGVVSTRSLGLSIFQAKFYNMEVRGPDISNAYPEATTKERYTLWLAQNLKKYKDIFL